MTYESIFSLFGLETKLFKLLFNNFWRTLFAVFESINQFVDNTDAYFNTNYSFLLLIINKFNFNLVLILNNTYLRTGLLLMIMKFVHKMSI
jgi:hypothetical protein